MESFKRGRTFSPLDMTNAPETHPKPLLPKHPKTMSEVLFNGREMTARWKSRAKQHDRRNRAKTELDDLRELSKHRKTAGHMPSHKDLDLPRYRESRDKTRVWHARPQHPEEAKMRHRKFDSPVDEVQELTHAFPSNSASTIAKEIAVE